MRNSSILFFTDNEALVHVINKQSCRDKSLMFFVRKLVLVCLSYNIVFKAKHIPGLHNKLADSLSRLQVQTFKQLAPAHMNSSPTEIPQHLQPSNWQSIFHTVFNHTLSTLPISPSVVALFVAYMFDSHYAPSTVNTYVSALGYSHKLMGFPDPAKVFYVSQMLKGYGKIADCRSLFPCYKN